MRRYARKPAPGESRNWDLDIAMFLYPPFAREMHHIETFINIPAAREKPVLYYSKLEIGFGLREEVSALCRQT